MKTKNINYIKIVNTLLKVNEDTFFDKITDDGIDYCKHAFPYLVSGMTSTGTFWAWYQIQVNNKYKEVYELMLRARMTANKINKIIEGKIVELHTIHPAGVILDKIYHEIENKQLQPLLDGTGVHIDKINTKSYAKS